MLAKGLFLVAAISLPAFSAFQEQSGKPVTPPAAASEQLSAPKPELSPEQRADIYMARKMYREAIDQYRLVKPQTAAILNKTGIAYHQMQQLDLAKKFYDRAVKADRSYSEAVNNIGTIYYARKSYRRAVSQYRKALQLAPESASIYSNLGTAYFARKQYKDAAAAYQRAISIDPDVFERKNQNSYGQLLQERNVEEHAKFHYYLAKTYAEQGMVDRSLQYIRRALEEGFKEPKKFLEEPEFAKVRETEAFKELMAQQPRAL